MNRRERWKAVLAQEVARWSALTADELSAQSGGDCWDCYIVEMSGEEYQVEVELLEDTADYVHVLVAVDDGTLPDSIKPECESFIRRRQG